MPNDFEVQPLTIPSESGVAYQTGVPVPISGPYQSIVIMVNRSTPECLPYLHKVAVGVDQSCDDFGCTRALVNAFKMLRYDLGVPSVCAQYNPNPSEFAQHCETFHCSKFEKWSQFIINYVKTLFHD